MTPDTATKNTLSKLYQELEQKLKQQLDEIEQNFQSQVENLEQEKQCVYQARIRHLRQGHENQLRQLRLKSIRDTQIRQQQRFWLCQQRCIDEILTTTRHQLEQQQPKFNYLEDWIEQVAPLLTATSAWHLSTSSHWSKQINFEKVALERSDLTISSISPAPILGGIILQNEELHIEIDGSWDQRLQVLIPELWQRWLKDVGKNDQD